MADHLTEVRPEHRIGLPPEYRVWCKKPGCDWTEKAITEGVAEGRGKHHEQYPHKS